MPNPTYADFTNLGANNNGLQPETIEERLLTIAAVLASGQNPDGTVSVNNAVTTATVPGGTAGNDGLAPVSSIGSANGYVWSASGQMYMGFGPPTDAVFGANYVAQPGDVALYYDLSASEPYIRVLSGQPTWVNLVPLILYGGA